MAGVIVTDGAATAVADMDTDAAAMDAKATDAAGIWVADGQSTAEPTAAAELLAPHAHLAVAEHVPTAVAEQGVDMPAAERAVDLAAAAMPVADSVAAAMLVAAAATAVADTDNSGASAAHPRSLRSFPAKPVCFGRRALCLWQKKMQ